MARSRHRSVPKKERFVIEKTSPASPEKRFRPRMPVIGEEMKAWSAALEREVPHSPRLTSKSMFGLKALYRGRHIFRILPRTRALGSASSLAFKLEKANGRTAASIQRQPRIATTVMKARRWYRFAMTADSDMRAALAWLRRAYAAAT